MSGDARDGRDGDGIPVVDPDAVERTEPVAGLGERTAFRVGGSRLVLIDVADATGWHARTGTVYGWVRAGAGRIEYGTEAEAARSLNAGDFLRVPGGAVHRYVAGDDGDGVELLALVDDGSEATAADRPGDGEDPEVVRSDGLVPAVESPNLVRETPFPGEEDVLTLRVRAAGGAAAGWHHHGDNVYVGYAVDGPSETEYGPAGESVARIEPGECFHVPPRLVHRDTNPTDEAHTGIIWLRGGAPWVVNVDGPE